MRSVFFKAGETREVGRGHWIQALGAKCLRYGPEYLVKASEPRSDDIIVTKGFPSSFLR